MCYPQNKTPFKKPIYTISRRSIKWIIAVIIGVTFSTSCASVVQSLVPSEFYERDVELTVNGKKGRGVLVVPQSTSYTVEMRTPGKSDVFVWGTCHRESKSESLGDRAKWVYTPSMLESQDGCSANIGSYSKSGKHSWAYIDFETPATNLPATIQCNGVTSKTTGVSICQAKTGLTQEILFDESVRYSPPIGCGLPGAVDGRRIDYPINPGLCVYAFIGESGRVHRLTTLGYSKVLVRDTK